MKKLWIKLDSIICKYLGFKKETVTPTVVSISDGKIVVKNISSFKRHQAKKTWESFCSDELKNINDESKVKLGVAAGKLLADKLVVSFDEIKIKEED